MKLEYRTKNIVRAVTAALVFSGLCWAILNSGSSPLPRLLETGDVWVQSSRPELVENLLLSSGTAELFETSELGERYLPEWKSRTDRLKKVMGSAYDWVAWGPWKTALRIDDDEPLMVVGAGLLAPLGTDLFRKAGFEEAENIGGRPALKKDFLAFVRADDLWLLGSRKSVKEALSSVTAPEPPDWDLGWDITRKYDLLAVVSPGKLRRMIYPAGAGEKNMSALNEWLDVNEWGGLLAYVKMDEEMLEARLNWLVGREKPVSRLLAGMKNDGDGGKWLHPDTVMAVSLEAGDPLMMWKQAERLYESRPTPSGFLWRAKEELKREVNLDIGEFLRVITGRLGFVRFMDEGKARTVIFADVGPGAASRLRRMEKGAFGEWKSGYQGIPLRYMPRLLAYGITGNRLLVASEPAVIGKYVKGAFRTGGPAKRLHKAADDVKGYPLAVAGTIPSGASAPKKKGSAAWFVAGIKCNAGRMESLVRIPLDAKAGIGAPWKPRLFSWCVAVGEVLGWIIAAMAMGAMVSNGLSSSRGRFDSGESSAEP